MQWLAPVWTSVVAPAALLIGGALVYTTLRPRAQGFGRVYWGGRASDDREQPLVSLVISGAAPPGQLHDTIAQLAEASVSGTFYLPGSLLSEQPEWMEHAHQAGHLLGNTGYDAGARQAWQTSPYWRSQIDRADDAVYDVIGRRPAFFQPPRGAKSPISLREARLTGMQAVTWTRRLRDRSPKLNARAAAATVPGSIVLIRMDQPKDRSALPAYIDALRARGFRWARLDELLDTPGYR